MVAYMGSGNFKAVEFEQFLGSIANEYTRVFNTAVSYSKQLIMKFILSISQ